MANVGGNPVPVALVGLGKHGERYLRHLREDVPELRVAVVSRRDEERGRATAVDVGARYVRDPLEAVTDSDVAAVILVVPPALHPELCQAAFAAGKAVLVEKPLAPTREAAETIAAAARDRGMPAMIAHTLRYDRVVRAVRERIEAVGELQQIWLSQRFEPSSLEWLDDPALSGGGIVLHTGVHGFDLVRHLSGAEPTHAAARTTRTATERTEDGFMAVFDMSAPTLLAGVSGSRAVDARNGAIEVAGREGQLLGDHVGGRLELVSGGQRTPIDVGPMVPTVRETLRDFAALLRGEAPAIALPLEEGVRSVAMAEAVVRSAESGGRCPV